MTLRAEGQDPGRGCWQRGAFGVVVAVMAFEAVSCLLETVRTSVSSGVLDVLRLYLPLTVVVSAAALLFLSRRPRYAAVCVILAAGVLIETLGPPWLEKSYSQTKKPLYGCREQLTGLLLSMEMYAEDADGRLPPADHWPRALSPYLSREKDPLLCPADIREQKQRDGDVETSYEMNQLLSGAPLGQIAHSEGVWLLADGDALCGVESWDFRHREVGFLGRPGAPCLNVVYANGHVGVCA